MRLLAAAIIMTFSISANAQGLKATADNLSWMAGCWELTRQNGAMLISEQWMRPAGGTLIGMSRTVNGGKTSAWEFIRIVTEGDGLDYVAKPNTNKEETVFKLARASTDEIVFENMLHDFPQRIIYRKAAPDTLFARIEGTRDGKLRGVDFPMKRVKCE